MDLFDVLTVSSIFTFIASEYMSIYAFRLGRDVRINRLAFLSFQSMACWSMGMIYIYQNAHDIEAFWLGDKFSAVGWIGFVGLFLHICLILTENEGLINRKWKLALLYLPTAALLFGEWFMMGHGVASWKINIFYSVYDAYYTLYALLALILLASWGINNDSRRKRIQAGIITGSVLFTWIVSFYMEHTMPIIIEGEGVADPINSFVFIMFTGFCYAVYKYEWLSVSTLIKPEDILDRIGELVLVVDGDGSILMVNPSFTRLSGYAKEEAVGGLLSSFMRQADEQGPFPVDERKVVEAILVTRSGDEIPLQVRASAVRDKASDVVAHILVGQDMRLVHRLKEEIENRKRKEADLEFRSFHDPLTGMYNRAYFEHAMKEIKEEQCYPFGIIIADIDGLKFANDTFGHIEGDRLLLDGARILTEITADEGIIARVGGDEFAILLRGVREEYIKGVEERLSQALERHNRTHPKVPLSISIGWAIGTGNDQDIVELYKTADNNMYRVKLSQGQSARSTMVQALMHTLGARHVETEDHAERLRKLAVRMGEEIGMSQYELAEISLLARFHDLGKVGIPDRSLLKQGPLNDEEWEEMKRHPEIGHRIAQTVPELMPIARFILLHHERWDGKGYPLGLAREQIPLECRIISIVDTYDAMTNERPYRAALSHEQAMEEIARGAGTQFDPHLVRTFGETMMNLANES